MKLIAESGSEEREIVVEPAGEAGRFRVVVGGRERSVDARRIDGTTWSLLVDGEAYVVDVEPGKEGELVVDVGGLRVPVKVTDPRRKLFTFARARETSGPLEIRAPMPGKIVKVLVKAGDRVTSGQGLLVIEAMKMENELRAPRDGTVDKVLRAEGHAVDRQEVLVVLS
ncbi:MAG TPA: biotin/lipoyl-containing protein [Haliangiales bacterium]|nr:biotin/lipoyl-containing protein [Haliangiales bacterium]